MRLIAPPGDTRLFNFIRDLLKGLKEPFDHPIRLASYTVDTLPAAGESSAGLIYVSDEAGGAVPAFSDGTNWRRVTDRAIVS
jgi:hypothetical protein